ncbi:MAG: response regulator [Cyanobacteria bacterium]|nr:response regulator [Cyanobacteria bacterium GSL.Bin21]
MCQRLRSQSKTTPILMLTARDPTGDKVSGLDAGGDDYLVKPFALEELAARTRALLRRHEADYLPTLTWGELKLDPNCWEAAYQGIRLRLTPKEYCLLEMFLRKGRLLLSYLGVMGAILAVFGSSTYFSLNYGLGLNAVTIARTEPSSRTNIGDSKKALGNLRLRTALLSSDMMTEKSNVMSKSGKVKAPMTEIGLTGQLGEGKTLY